MITGAETAHLGQRAPVILLEGRLPVLETPAAQALGLRDGQVVRPTIEVHDGRLRLILDKHAIDLPPHLQLPAGDRSWWRVQIDGRGQWVLQPLAQPPAPDPAAAAPVPMAGVSRMDQLALRPPSLSALVQLMQPGALQALFLAAPQAGIRALIDQLMRPWPTTALITPEALRKALRQGGWSQEAGLARGDDSAVDTKSLLRLLLSTWTSAPESTRELLQGAVDDIESRQMQMVVDQQAGRETAMSMLLPFCDGEPVHLRWKREKEGAERDGRRAPWVVDLHTRSSEFGEVWLHTRIGAGTVDLVMWAMREDLVSRARSAAPSLQAWLQQAGLQMTGLQIIHGERPGGEAGSQVPQPEPGRLVDIRA